MRTKASQRPRGTKARPAARPVRSARRPERPKRSVNAPKATAPEASAPEQPTSDGDTRPDWMAVATLVGVLMVALAILYPGLLMGWAIPITTEGGVLSDLLDPAAPLQSFAARTLGSGHLPLWFPGADLGLPLTGIPEAMPWYPFSTPLFAVFGPQRAIAWALVFHLLLAGVGAGMLVRRWGASPLGQSLAALATAYGLWLPDHFRQLNLFITASWVPVVWWALDTVLEDPRLRTAVYLGLAGGLMALGNHLQIVHHTVVVLSLWAVARTVASGGWQSEGVRPYVLSRLGALGLAAVLALLVAAPHLVPGLEMARLAERAELLRTTHFQFPPHWIYLRTLINPWVAGTPWEANSTLPGAVYWEEAQFVGLVTLALVTLAPWIPRARRTLIPLVVVALAGLTLAYGQLSPTTQWIYGVIPGLDLLRFYHRHLWFVSLALSLAGGLGLTVLEARVRRHIAAPWAAPVVGVVVLAVLVFDLARVTPVFCPVAEAAPLFDEPASSVTLRQQGAHPEAFAERTYAVGGITETEMSIPATVAWGSDLNTLVEARRLFYPQHANLWGWQTLGGYIGVTPSWTRAAILDQYSSHGALIALEVAYTRSRQTRDLDALLHWAGTLGAHWITAPRQLPSNPALDALGAIPGQAITTWLYRLRDATPAAWIASTLRRFGSDSEASAYIRGGSSDLRGEALLTALTAHTPDASAGGTATVHDADRPERFTVSTTLDQPGLLVVNSGYHPRWRWSLDGHTWHAPERVDVCQLGAWLPAGHHEVHFEFDGTIEMLSLLAGLVGWLVAGGILVRTRRVS